MQFIFVTLLLANIMLAIWLYVSSANTSQLSVGDSQMRVQGRSLVLLEELNVNQAQDLGVERKLLALKALTPAKGQTKTNNQCVILGPFVNREAAQDMVKQLSLNRVSSSVESMAFPAGVGHWVYLPPYESRKEALAVLASLQKRKVDSYIVPKGENKNAISLGMFTKIDLAQAQLGRVQALNYDARLKAVQRTYNELWVMIKHQHEDKITSAQWPKLLKMKKNIKKRKNFCLGVAL